jgi:hypothetical protein
MRKLGRPEPVLSLDSACYHIEGFQREGFLKRRLSKRRLSRFMLSRGEESMKEREQRDLVYVKRDLVREVCMCDRKENLLEKRPY